jgi:hypothetical protein
MKKERKLFLNNARERNPDMKKIVDMYFLRRYKYQVLNLPDKFDMTIWITL